MCRAARAVSATTRTSSFRRSAAPWPNSTPATKNAASHRGTALRRLLALVKERGAGG